MRAGVSAVPVYLLCAPKPREDRRDASTLEGLLMSLIAVGIGKPLRLQRRATRASNRANYLPWLAIIRGCIGTCEDAGDVNSPPEAKAFLNSPPEAKAFLTAPRCSEDALSESVPLPVESKWLLSLVSVPKPRFDVFMPVPLALAMTGIAIPAGRVSTRGIKVRVRCSLS